MDDDNADWTVLSHPPPRANANAVSQLAALTLAQRQAIARAISERVTRQLERQIHPWFSTTMQERARIDVFDAGLRDGALVLHFVADHYNYNYAQSGSDWADHYIFVGNALIGNGAPTDITFEPHSATHLTERESDDYDARAAVRAARDAIRAKHDKRCPQCRSTAVRFEPLFDDYRLACESCGHSRVYNNYPDPDDDGAWDA